MFNFLSLIQIALAVYLIVIAIPAKHKLFTHRFIKKGKAEFYKKWLRIGLFVTGGIMGLLGIVNLIGSLQPEESSLFQSMYRASTVLGVLVLTVLVALFVLYQAVTDKEKKTVSARPVAPRAAFYFDDEPEEPKKGTKQKR